MFVDTQCLLFALVMCGLIYVRNNKEPTVLSGFRTTTRLTRSPSANDVLTSVACHRFPRGKSARKNSDMGDIIIIILCNIII